MGNRLAELYRDEDGISVIEYVLIGVLVSVAAITGMTYLGNVENNKLDNVARTIG